VCLIASEDEGRISLGAHAGDEVAALADVLADLAAKIPTAIAVLNISKGEAALVGRLDGVPRRPLDRPKRLPVEGEA